MYVSSLRGSKLMLIDTGMSQVWYIGPLAKLVGEYGGDMGNYVGFAFAALVYAPLRWFEVRKFGR